MSRYWTVVAWTFKPRDDKPIHYAHVPDESGVPSASREVGQHNSPIVILRESSTEGSRGLYGGFMKPHGFYSKSETDNRISQKDRYPDFSTPDEVRITCLWRRAILVHQANMTLRVNQQEFLTVLSTATAASTRQGCTRIGLPGLLIFHRIGSV